MSQQVNKGGEKILDHKSMTLNELAEYINEQLDLGRNLTKVAKEDFNVNESTIRKKLTKDNIYKRIGNQYVRQSHTQSDTDKNNVVNQPLHNVRQDVRHIVTNHSEQVFQSNNIVSHTSSQDVTNQKYNQLLDNYDILMQIIEDYKTAKEHGTAAFTGLVVELPVEHQKDFRITLRVNDTVYKDFKKFADNNKQFTLKELVSQALKEFIDKYR